MGVENVNKNNYFNNLNISVYGYFLRYEFNESPKK